jgi:hypothetical protein
VRGFFTRRRILVSIAILALLLIGFEVGVRLMPPDEVSYDIQTIEPSGPPDPHLHGVITDPVTVARWRAVMTAQPDSLLISAYIERWQGVGCASGTYFVATYRFTWHGLPVEVVSPGPSCAAGFQVTSGGISDWNTYIIDPLPQP